MTGVSNVTFDEIEVGRTVSISRPVTETEVQAMVLLSGDTESWDVGPDSSKGRNSATAQAVGAEAILSMLLNRRLPGPGTRILAQDLRFEGVIGLGAEVTASVTAREKRTDDAIVVFDCRVAQGGQALVAGSVTVKAPTRRIAYDEVATPQLILRHNDAFTKLLRRCEGLAPVSCAIVHPCDRDSLLGPIEAARRGLIVPVLVAMLYGINAHYRSIEDRLLIASAAPVHLALTVPRIVVPISRIDRASLRALSVARGLGGEVHAVHISFDADGAKAFKRRWAQVVGAEIPLESIISPYRALLPPLLRYIEAIDSRDPERPIIVVLAEFVPSHWWEALLHNQTALLLKLRLFTRRNTSVLDVPYHLDDADIDDDRRPG